MKFKKLNEALTDSQIYENLKEYIYNKLELAVDNLAIQAESDIEGYNADWCSDYVNPHAYGYLSKVAGYFADELMRYSPRGEIIESLNKDNNNQPVYINKRKRAIINGEDDCGYDEYDLEESISENKLYADAEDIADRISEFLDKTSRIDNISDYLDEDDFEHIGKTQDALYDFAQAYSRVNESLLTEKKWDYQLKNGVALRNAIDAEDYGQIKNSLIAAYKEIHEVMPEKFDEYDLENKLEDLEYLDTEPDEDIEISEDDIRENFDYELSDLYDLCDNLNIWVSLSN